MELDIKELKEMYVRLVIDTSRISFINKLNKFNRELHYKAEVDKLNFINQSITTIGDKICSPENQYYSSVYSFEMVQLHLKEIEKNSELQLWKKDHLEFFHSPLKDKLNNDIEYSITNQFKLQSWAKKYDNDYAKGILEFASYLVEHLSNVMLSIQLKGKEQEHKNNKNKAINSKQTFESLFRNRENAKIVEDIFETKDYTMNGEWVGISKDKTELLAAYYVLKKILQPGRPTPQATVFYNHFHLIVGKNNTKKGEYITARMLTEVPKNDNLKEFESIFSHILPK